MTIFNAIRKSLNISDTILHFGVCDNQIIYELSEWYLLELNATLNEVPEYIGVDINHNKMIILQDHIDRNQLKNVTLYTDTMQSYIDNNLKSIYDQIIITGVFNKWRYSERQYDFIFKSINKCLEFAKKSVIFSLTLNDNYNIIYLITNLVNTYNSIEINKISDINYVFTIIKE